MIYNILYSTVILFVNVELDMKKVHLEIQPRDFSYRNTRVITQ